MPLRAQLHTTTAIVVLKALAEFRTRYTNNLIISKFLDSDNFIAVSPKDVHKDGSAEGEYYAIHRQNPAFAWERTGADYNNYNYGGFKPSSVKRVIANTHHISSASEITAPASAANAKSDYIPMGLLTGTQGSTLDGGTMQLVASFIDAHFKAMEEQLYGFLFRHIRDDHNVKVDGDSQNWMGQNVTFAADTGRAAISQVVDLTSVNTDTNEVKATELETELRAAAAGIPMSTSGQIFVLVPSRVYSRYKTILGALSPTIVYERGVENGPAASRYHSGASYYDHAEFRIVNVPDQFFPLETIATVANSYPCYILPASSIKMLMIPRPMNELVNFGGSNVLNDSGVMNFLASTGFLKPGDYGSALANSRSDIFTDNYIASRGRGTAKDLTDTNIIRTYFVPNTITAGPESMGVGFHANAFGTVIRMQPQYIQLFGVPSALV